MITEDDINECLIEVDEEKLAELLRDDDCFSILLVKAIVNYAAFDGNYEDVDTALHCAIDSVRSHRYKLAANIAQDKDNARRFQADMKDKFE